MYTTKLATEYHTVLSNHVGHTEIHSGSTTGWRMITDRTPRLSRRATNPVPGFVYYNPYDILSNTPI
jgi:hypothetical protein